MAETLTAWRGPPGDFRWRPWLHAGRGLSARELELIWAVLAQIFIAHLLFGANRNDLSLAFALVQAALVLRALTAPWARQALRPGRLLLPGILYAIVLVFLVISLIPGENPRLFAAFPWLVSPTGSINTEASLIALCRMGGLACVFIQGILIGASRSRAAFFMNAFVAAATLYAGVAILGFWIAPDTLYGVDRPYHSDRLAGTFLSANSAGAFFGMALVASFGLLFRRGRSSRVSGRRIAVSVSVALLAIALLLTASRGALAATLAASAFLMLGRAAMARRTGWVRSSLMAATGAAIIVVAAVLLSPISGRLSAAATDIDVRAAIINAHWPAIRSELWQGYGAGAFERVNAMVQTPSTVDRLWSVRALHNVYLQWLEEAGLVGTLAMWGVIAVVLGGITSHLLGRRPSRWPPVVIAMSVMILLHGFVDYGLEVPSLSAQWALFLGLGYASTMPRLRGQNKRGGIKPGFSLSRRPRLRLGGVAICASATLLLAGGILATGIVRQNRATEVQSLDALREATRRSPADGQAWLIAAVAERNAAKRCARLCVTDLSNSYNAAPLSRTIFAWRTRFVLEHWDQVPVTLRVSALRHIHAQWRTRSGRRDIEGMSRVVFNPAGRLAIKIAANGTAPGDSSAAVEAAEQGPN
ncbi:MAG TPA: O-antigen ligase family protein, partial [Brevundimonas sp.]